MFYVRTIIVSLRFHYIQAVHALNGVMDFTFLDSTDVDKAVLMIATHCYPYVCASAR